MKRLSPFNHKIGDPCSKYAYGNISIDDEVKKNQERAEKYYQLFLEWGKSNGLLPAELKMFVLRMYEDGLI